ncbi:MAG: Gfo/Idh/MocA family oxidoreductase [Planctomycetota bacterium]
MSSKVRFAAIGLNHGHIHGQTRLLLAAGAELVSFFAPEEDLSAAFQKEFPQAKRARAAAEILEDNSIQLIASAAVPNARAALGAEALLHGKDFFADKPGFTTLEQLAEVRRVQAETKRAYWIYFGERFESRATVKAGELVAAGAIGKVVQMLGLGPHRANVPSRPEWFFKREQYGGILCDIASHQLDQFLQFTGSTSVEVVASQVGNFKFPQYPGLEDFGDMVLRSEQATGYFRVDWYTPDGLETWGDGRLFLLGTEGFIEARKYCDLAGRPGGDHLFLCDHKGTRCLDCKDVALTCGAKLVEDVLERTETAMSQAQVFLASELALRAQAQAQKLGNLKGG